MARPFGLSQVPVHAHLQEHLRLWGGGQSPRQAECLGIMGHGLCSGMQPYGLISRQQGINDGLVLLCAAGVMVGQDSCLLCHPLALQGFDGLANSPVQGASTLPQETLVGDILDQGVLELVCSTGRQPALIQQLRVDQLSQLMLQGRVIECRELLHQRVGKLPPDHRPELRQAFGASQPMQAALGHRSSSQRGDHAR